MKKSVSIFLESYSYERNEPAGGMHHLIREIIPSYIIITKQLSMEALV